MQRNNLSSGRVRAEEFDVDPEFGPGQRGLLMALAQKKKAPQPNIMTAKLK